MRFGRIWIRITIPCLLLLAGCVTDGGKALNHQNKGAGEILASHSDPFVAATGKDIYENSAALEGEIGQPKEAKPYSPENSAAARNAQAAQLAARAAWKEFFDWAVGAGAAAVGLGGAWAWFSKLKLGKVVSSIVKGVEGLPPDLAKTAKDAILGQSLKGGVSDALRTIVKQITP